MDFVAIEKRHQLNVKTKYSNMNELALLANKNIKKETRIIRIYTSAKYNIIGFDKQGNIFYPLIQKTNPIG